MNLYTYVSNNPLTHIDPSGHAAKKSYDEIARLIDSAIGSRPNSREDLRDGDDVYYVVRGILGAIAQTHMPSKDNNDFIWLYNFATGNHYDATENTKENRDGARQTLIEKLGMPSIKDSFIKGTVGAVTLDGFLDQEGVLQSAAEEMYSDNTKYIAQKNRAQLISELGPRVAKPDPLKSFAKGAAKGYDLALKK